MRPCTPDQQKNCWHGFGNDGNLASMTSPESHPRDPLHGITLESILNQLVQRHGWGEMGRRIPIRCFQFNPTVKSSLTFLRKTPWARKKVEDCLSGSFENCRSTPGSGGRKCGSGCLPFPFQKSYDYIPRAHTELLPSCYARLRLGL
jgi:hypothetical protein